MVKDKKLKSHKEKHKRVEIPLPSIINKAKKVKLNESEKFSLNGTRIINNIDLDEQIKQLEAELDSNNSENEENSSK